MVNDVKEKEKKRCQRLQSLMYSVTPKERHSVVQEDGNRGGSRKGVEENRAVTKEEHRLRTLMDY